MRRSAARRCATGWKWPPCSSRRFDRHVHRQLVAANYPLNNWGVLVADPEHGFARLDNNLVKTPSAPPPSEKRTGSSSETPRPVSAVGRKFEWVHPVGPIACTSVSLVCDRFPCVTIWCHRTC